MGKSDHPGTLMYRHKGCPSFSQQALHVILFFFCRTRKKTFGISYLSRDRSGAEIYTSLVSDWDLDVAFVSAAKPFLQLKMDIKPSEDSKNTRVSLK